MFIFELKLCFMPEKIPKFDADKDYLFHNRLSNNILTNNKIKKMEINASKGSSLSFIDKELEVYNCEGNLGLRNHNNGKEVLPYLSSIITTDNFVLFKVSGKWGIMDRELCLILPSIYNEINAVKKIDTDAFIKRCYDCQLGDSAEIDLHNPQQIVIKRNYAAWSEWDGRNLAIFDMISNIDEADSLIALKMKDDSGKESSSTNRPNRESSLSLNKRNRPRKVLSSTPIIGDRLNQLSYSGPKVEGGHILEIDNNKIKNGSSFSNTGIIWLWHYKDNTYIISGDRKTYGFANYTKGRFETISILKGANGGIRWFMKYEGKDEGFLPYSIYYCPQISFYKNDFISVCLPTIKEENESIVNLSGKWALYRLVQESQECDDEVTEKSHLQQLTPFVLDEAPVQISDGFAFICRACNKDYVIKYDCGNEKETKSISFSNESTIFANNLSSLDFEKKANDYFLEKIWSIPSVHEKIELRNDGLFNVSDGSFYGLLDKNLKELVPINYDYPIEISKQLNIVCRNGLKGVINSKGELIVPCIYSYIQISKDNLEIYHKDYDYDEEEKESVEDNYLVDKGIPRDAKLSDEDYIIAGINSENEKEREKKREKEKEIEKLSGVLAAFFRTEHDPRYAPNARVDLFLPNGQQLTSCVIETDGNIQFNHKCGCVLIRTCKTNAYIYYINTKKETIRYSQIQIINSNSFMVYQDYRVGILSINENVEDSDVWIVPCVYSRMTKINNFLFGLKRQEDKKILDVLDVLDNYSVVFSTDFDFPENLITERLRKFLLDDAPKELQDRIFKDGYLDFFNWFPVEEYYPEDDPSYNYDPYESYSTYDSLMDGLDGEPDAYWNIK